MLVLPEDYTSQVTNHSRVKRLSSGFLANRGASREGRTQDSGPSHSPGAAPSSTTPSTPIRRASSGMGDASTSSPAARSTTARNPYASGATAAAARTVNNSLCSTPPRPATGSLHSPAKGAPQNSASINAINAFSHTGQPGSVGPGALAQPQHDEQQHLKQQQQPSSEGGPSSSAADEDADDESVSGVSCESEMLPQGVDVLAALASLGVNEQLRARVQDALDTLEAAAANNGVVPLSNPRHQSHSHSVPGGKGAPAAGVGLAAGPARAVDNAYRKKLDALETKLAMSRSIMRKLYHKTVELEKEAQVARANSGPVSLTHSTASLLAASSGEAAAGTSGRPGTAAGAAAGVGASSPLAQALQERDQTIVQLQHALDAARRRCALLESQLSGTGAGGGRGRPGAGSKDAGLKEVLAQSQLHFHKYRQIREDYNRLLYKRAGTIQTSKAASSAAKVVVDEMQSRLRKEIAEREAEAALYSAKLYETERQMSDWYVERRMLEDHIAKLSEEAAARDKLDAEIESCVCGLFERLKLLESTNEQLRAQLAAAGVDVDAGGGGSAGADSGATNQLVCE